MPLDQLVRRGHRQYWWNCGVYPRFNCNRSMPAVLRNQRGRFRSKIPPMTERIPAAPVLRTKAQKSSV